jgi:extradiol dioxygenase family protein
MKEMKPFHAFFYVTDLQKSVQFYRDTLGCEIKRSTENSFTIDFYGHGISFEYNPQFKPLEQYLTCNSTDVDDRQYVPSMHWGVNFTEENDFNEILNRIEKTKTQFVVSPTEYNSEQSNLQRLFFIKDPTGYVLEFRYMSRPFKLKELDQWDQRGRSHTRKQLS